MLGSNYGNGSLNSGELNISLAVVGDLHCGKRTYVDPLSLSSGRRKNELSEQQKLGGY